MKTFSRLTVVLLFLASCSSEVSEEKRPLVDAINKKVDDIDANHRVEIYEDDFHVGDSVYKVRGYFMDENLLKLVGILYAPNGERDDYFYFENGKPIFTGHIVVLKNELLASEYKYYFNNEGVVDEALYWEDHYKRGKQFPHEKFREFTPDLDSLMASENERLNFFLSKLDVEGFEVRHENENLGANTER